MYIDWITWSIWLIGFVILVTWIVVPYREFRALRRRRGAPVRRDDQSADRPSGGAGERGG